MTPTDSDWPRRQAPVLCIAGLLLVPALAWLVSPAGLGLPRPGPVGIGRPETM